MGKITVTKLFASIDGKKLEKIDGTYTFALYESPDAAGTPVATAVSYTHLDVYKRQML